MRLLFPNRPHNILQTNTKMNIYCISDANILFGLTTFAAAAIGYACGAAHPYASRSLQSPLQRSPPRTRRAPTPVPEDDAPPRKFDAQRLTASRKRKLPSPSESLDALPSPPKVRILEGRVGRDGNVQRVDRRQVRFSSRVRILYQAEATHLSLPGAVRIRTYPLGYRIAAPHSPYAQTEEPSDSSDSEIDDALPLAPPSSPEPALPAYTLPGPLPYPNDPPLAPNYAHMFLANHGNPAFTWLP
ncbi:hypothetical protein BV25DRAFT_591343 [Artomyces pyxidatus]|uniref:Uncharacterized protein n=1 Tax=Artomyces pyxidatus TaxID=48021 RepID=A0ACB8T3B2_9AGAM|nr:hypothetical protein BV25DRAFT_591343 [Artomyces pyxidatus]